MLIDYENDKFKEECGIFGIWKNKYSNLRDIFYPALMSLQHRGEDGAGVSVITENGIETEKNLGEVSNLFNKEFIGSTEYTSGIGHVRYSTYGDNSLKNLQPMDGKNDGFDITIAHNGNLINVNCIKDKLKTKGIKFNTTSDSEIILKFLIYEIKKGKTLIEAVLKILNILKGAFSVVVLTKEKFIGFRDIKGIRPLCIGKIGEDYVLTSESCVLDSLDGQVLRDVNPGEIVCIDNSGINSINKFKYKTPHTCALEYIYFSKEDSIIDKNSVYDFRINSGKLLYKECPANADIVIGMPSSGLLAAIGFSKASKIPYEIGIIKNPYAGRNFIKSNKEKRNKNINFKLSVIKECVKNKRVIIVDDSIVRGTSSKRIVEKLRVAGALEVHFRVASPIVKSNCNLGIDIKTSKELLSFNKSLEEMKEFIGADSLGFLSLKSMSKCLRLNIPMCTGCFNGYYGDK